MDGPGSCFRRHAPHDRPGGRMHLVPVGTQGGAELGSTLIGP